LLERLIVAAALVALFALAIRLGRAWYARRNARVERRLRASAEVRAGTDADVPPRIVYFTTRTCVVCRVQQEPAMRALGERLPEVVVEKHDAVDEPDLAREYGVLSVPTTAVYDRAGRLVTVNRGFTPAAILLAQVEGRAPELEGGAAMSSEDVA
jgi:thiol-disulfide isomerase/thioredoxin